MKSQLHTSTILVLIVSLFLSACGSAVVTTVPPALPATTVPATAVPQPTIPQPTTPPPAAALPHVTIKIGMYPYASFLVFYIAQVEGYFAQEGITAIFIPVTSDSANTAALANGQIDVSGGFLQIGVINAIAEGSGIQYVADKGYLDSAGCNYAAWVVRNDILTTGKLDDPANLTGLKFAFTKATISEYSIDLLLKPANLSSADLNDTDLPPFTALAALSNGSVDMAQFSEPWVTRSSNTGTISDWKPLQSILPNFQFAMVYFGPSITKQNPELGKRFMVAYLKAVRQYNEGKTDRNVALMMALTKGSEKEVKQMCWQSIHSDGSINAQSVLDFEQWAVDKGYLATVIPQSEFWDSQYIDYANGALK